jgi:phospholipid/cholesterol/gamma-HCH transport system substrate-binding protein
VQIAGLNVGHIIGKSLSIKPPRPELATQKRFARITLAISGTATIYENAMVYKKATSLLGGYYIEIDPGSAQVRGKDGKLRAARILKTGEEVRHVMEGVTTDDVIRQINDVMPVLKAVAEDIRSFTQGPLQTISKNIDEAITENRQTVKTMLDNVEAISASFRRISTGAEGDVDVILDDIKATTGMIRTLVGRTDKDVEETAGKVKSGLDKISGAIDKLDAVFGDVKGITGDLQEGKGTFGRLLKDEELIDGVQEVVADAGSFVKGVTELQTWVGLHTEYNFMANSIKTYLRVEIQPRPDKYYLVELVQDPRGARDVTTTITRTDDPSKPQLVREEKVTISDAFRFSFMFAKRLSLATFRFGIKENTGGIGLDLHFWDDRIRIESDLFDFSANVWPRLKVLAAWQFFSRLYVVGGIDDALNNRPIDGSAGGRDYFIGGQLRFNDEDLKTLLMFGGSALGGLSGE